MASRYIGQINAKYNSTDIIITPDRAAADQDGAPIVNTTGAQTISGAKTFSGSTTFTGKVTASNTGNAIKVANHDTALISNDVLSAKDINTPNGDANNLLHRNGSETLNGQLNEVNMTGVKIISSSQAYNNLYLLNRGRYATLIFGNTTDDKTLAYRTGDVGITYASDTQSSVRVQAYAPPNDSNGGNPPIKCGLIIACNSSNNAASIIALCQVWDSASAKYVSKEKVLASFSNGAWN